MQIDEAIQRFEKQLADLKSEQEKYEGELAGISAKREKAEGTRDKHIFAAKVENSDKAKVKLDSARIELTALATEEAELEILVAKIKERISELENQKAASEKQKVVIELNELREQRFGLDASIEEHMTALVGLLSQYQVLSNKLTTEASAIGVSHPRLDGRGMVVNYLNCQLRPLYPQDFGTIGYRVESLSAVDRESLDAIFSGKGLLPKTENTEQKVG